MARWPHGDGRSFRGEEGRRPIFNRDNRIARVSEERVSGRSASCRFVALAKGKRKSRRKDPRPRRIKTSVFITTVNNAASQSETSEVMISWEIYELSCSLSLKEIFILLSKSLLFYVLLYKKVWNCIIQYCNKDLFVSRFLLET